MMTSLFGPRNKHKKIPPSLFGMSEIEILHQVTLRHDHVQVFNICNIKMFLFCTVNYTVFKVKLYNVHFKYLS